MKFKNTKHRFHRHTIDSSYPLLMPRNDPIAFNKFNSSNKTYVECHCMVQKGQHPELLLATPTTTVLDQYTEYV